MPFGPLRSNVETLLPGRPGTPQLPAREDPLNKACPSMLASIAADMLNQSRTDLGIPNRINLTTSRSSGLVLSLPDLNFDSVADTANGIRQRISPDAIKAEVADYIKRAVNHHPVVSGQLTKLDRGDMA